MLDALRQRAARRQDRKQFVQVSERMGHARAARKAAVAGSEDLVAAVEEVLFRHDPMGLNFGGNTDEYRAEAETIVLRLGEARSSAEVQGIAHEEFAQWFGPTDAGDPVRYADLSVDVWAIYHQRDRK